jgi:hypothetical protein
METVRNRMLSMRHQRPHNPRAQIVGASDLFEYAQRQAPPTTDDELWSMKVVRMKTGLSRTWRSDCFRGSATLVQVA